MSAIKDKPTDKPISEEATESYSGFDYLIYQLGKAVTSPIGRWVTIGAWVAALVALSLFPPKLSTLYDEKITSSIGEVESVRASQLLKEKFPEREGLPAIVVFSNAAGLNETDFAKVKQISDWLTSPQKPAKVESVVSIDTVPQARAELLSANGKALTSIVSLDNSDGTSELSPPINAIRDYVKPLAVNGLEINVTGPGGVIADAVAVFSGANVTLLIATVVLVLVLLIIVYRSPILALMPLVAVGIVVTAIGGIIALMVKGGWFAVSQQSTSIMDVLLFGVGVDYTIFMVSRYREELRREPDSLVALRRAFVGVAEAIISSAATVILALLVLLLATLGLYKSLGPSLAVAVFVMLIAGLTLVPAVISIFRRAAFWPAIPRYEVAEKQLPKRSFWGWCAKLVRRRPVATVWVTSLFLLVLGLGNLGTPDVFNFLTGFRTPTDSLAGYKVLANNFQPGTLAPTDLVVVLPNGTNAYEKLVALEQVSQAVGQVPNVVAVTGPTRPGGKPTVDAATLQQDFANLPAAIKDDIRNGQSGGQPPAGVTGGQPPAGVSGGIPAINPATIGLFAQTNGFISKDNSTVRLNVTLGSDPYGTKALDTVEPLRLAARNALNQAGLGNNVLVSGVTGTAADTRTVNFNDKLIVVPSVIILTTIVLALLLRSLVAPIYLIIAVLLNFFAAMGAASFLFVVIQGDEGRAYSLPLYAFIFLVSLGADYTIFLMTRVREEARKLGLEEGTAKALTSTGGVITSAGLILAGTFLVLTILPLRELYQLGLVVALGVVLDTLVVRGFLVPATILLFKRWNWWPGTLAGAPRITASETIPPAVKAS